MRNPRLISFVKWCIPGGDLNPIVAVALALPVCITALWFGVTVYHDTHNWWLGLIVTVAVTMVGGQPPLLALSIARRLIAND